MNAKRYKARLTQDLDRWIERNWVPAESRVLILADVPDDATGRAAIWLGMTGAALAGLAIIAGIADNWAVVPRTVKLALLLAGFWAAIIGAAWADRRGKAHLRNGTTLIAALIFAASIGLLGQALNIPGDPTTALLIAAIGAGVLAIGGESTAAGLVYLVLSGFWYWSDGRPFEFSTKTLTLVDLGAAGFLAGGLILAALLRARLLLHAALALAGPFVLALALRLLPSPVDAYATFGFWTLCAAVALFALKVPGARTIFGWSVWHALIAFGIAGFDDDGYMMIHRLSWLAVSVAVIAVGARTGQGWATAGGVLSLVAACFAVLIDLGMSLSIAAGIFGVAALVVLGITFFLSRRSKERAP